MSFTLKEVMMQMPYEASAVEEIHVRTICQRPAKFESCHVHLARLLSQLRNDFALVDFRVRRKVDPWDMISRWRQNVDLP